MQNHRFSSEACTWAGSTQSAPRLDRRRFLRAGLGLTGLAALGPILGGCAGNGAFLSAPGAGGSAPSIAGEPAPPSILAARALGELDPETADGLEFTLWQDFRRLARDVESGAVPMGVASTGAIAALYNQGAPVKLLNVYVWGVLYLIATDVSIQTWADLLGRKVGIPVRGSVTDLTFQTLLQANGIDPETGLVPRYASDPVEAVEVLLGGQVQAVLLPEPWATRAIRQVEEEEDSVANRALDLQAAWGEMTGGPPRIPQVGVFVSDSFLNHAPDRVVAFQAALGHAVAWAQSDPAAAGALGQALLREEAEIVAESLAHTRLELIPAPAARPELEEFYARMAAINPAVLGGGVPDAGFYADLA